MTCVIGFIDKGKIYMGADSAGVGNLDIRTRVDEKVFFNGDFIIGYTTSFRMGQLLKYSLNVPKQKKDQTDYQYMCTTFIDTVIKCFKDNGFAKINDNVIEGGIFIVGYRGLLYRIEDDYQVAINSVPYDACGCGEDYALGAIHSSMIHAPKLSPEQRITDALGAAEEFSSGVRGPFKVLTK